MKSRALIESNDDLGLPWEQWADGVPHLLKRKRDFGDYDPELVRQAAKVAAKRMGKGVQAVLDRMSGRKGVPSRAIWVQFTDAEIRVGEPCPCGGRRLLRIHPSFARCAVCDNLLLLSPPKVRRDSFEDEDEDEEIEEEIHDPAAILRTLTEVHLSRLEHVEDRETYRGYARRSDEPVLLLVQFRADPGERFAPDDVLARVAAVQIVPLHHLEGMIERDALLSPGAAWDLVF
jgi:hypothetical protein